MAESKPNSKTKKPISGESVKAPNVFERVKDEFEAVLHHDHHKETHGLRYDVDENTSMSEVKAPNVFERAKEEIEALVGVIHPKKDKKSRDSESNSDIRDSVVKDHLRTDKLEQSETNVMKPNLVVKTKEESKSLMHKPHHHHKETHGRSDDINENTPITEVKGPSVFERAKEEIEALIHSFSPRKDSGNVASSPKMEGGLPVSIGRGLEKLCSPRSHNKD